MKLLHRKPFQFIWLLILLAFPIALWIMPSTSFDESEVILCPSRAFFGVECFGCGLTRGVMHMHHAEVDDAVYFNLGSPFVYPFLIGLWLVWVYKAAGRLEIIPPWIRLQVERGAKLLSERLEKLKKKRRKKTA